MHLFLPISNGEGISGTTDGCRFRYRRYYFLRVILILSRSGPASVARSTQYWLLPRHQHRHVVASDVTAQPLLPADHYVSVVRQRRVSHNADKAYHLEIGGKYRVPVQSPQKGSRDWAGPAIPAPARTRIGLNAPDAAGAGQTYALFSAIRIGSSVQRWCLCRVPTRNGKHKWRAVSENAKTRLRRLRTLSGEDR